MILGLRSVKALRVRVCHLDTRPEPLFNDLSTLSTIVINRTTDHSSWQQQLVARSKRRSGQRERVSLDDAHEKAIPLTPSQVKDKANHAVVIDKSVQEKLSKDVPSYRLITVSTLVDRLKINGSIARKALKDLEDEGKIKKVVNHARLAVYSMLYHMCLPGVPSSAYSSMLTSQPARAGAE